MVIELRSVGIHEADLIERLFQEVYNREQGIEYWKWCFKNPYGYMNSGMFENNRLIGYHASQLTENSACMYSAMTHPKYRKQGIFMKLTTDLHERLSLLRDYTYLFSNEMIRPIHIEKEGYTEVYQIKEYRISFKKDFMNPRIFHSIGALTEFELWRYRDHPLVKYQFQYDYEFEHKAFYSLYEDGVQIIDYNQDLQRTIDIGMYIAYAFKKEFVSFWSEGNWEYPYIPIPTWKHYKILNPLNIDMDDIMKNDKCRMGMSDVY